MKIVAITGAGGYLGQRLISYLEEQDWCSQIVGTDIIEPKIKSQKLTFLKKDIRDHSLIDFFKEQNVDKFYDIGEGICHQLMSYNAKPGMVIVGSDSHTCTAGAFNALAAGIDRTEAAGLWM